MELTVNGSPVNAPDGATAAALVEQLGLKVGSVVVEHNGRALLPSEVRDAVLADGDVLELVRAVAGG